MTLMVILMSSSWWKYYHRHFESVLKIFFWLNCNCCCFSVKTSAFRFPSPPSLLRIRPKYFIQLGFLTTNGCRTFLLIQIQPIQLFWCQRILNSLSLTHTFMYTHVHTHTHSFSSVIACRIELNPIGIGRPSFSQYRLQPEHRCWRRPRRCRRRRRTPLPTFASVIISMGWYSV